MTTQHNNLVPFHFIHRYNIASTFEPSTSTTFTAIAKKCELPESDVKRLLPHAMTFRVFQKVEAGIIGHTAALRALRDDAYLKDWVGFNCEEMWPAALRVSYKFSMPHFCHNMQLVQKH